jgi:acyl carrier protein
MPSRASGDRDLGRHLHDHLRQSLPGHMVPSTIIMLAAWPLTPNGKLDRRALPPPEAARAAPSGTYVATRNATEASMAAIWAEVLHLPQVGIHDDFFDLGGHSLAALQLFGLVRQRFHRDLPMSSFFLRPTIAQLAELVDGPPARDPIGSPSTPTQAGGSRRGNRLVSFSKYIFIKMLKLRGICRGRRA